jgi:glycogen synthase
MRVLIIGPFPPPHGGVQTHVVAIRQMLRDRGIDCQVINLTRNRKPDADGVFYPKNALATLKLLVTLRYDIVHLHFGGDLTPRLLALAFVCSLMRIARTILTLHSGGFPSSRQGKRARSRSLLGYVLRRLDRVIGVNGELVALFERIGVSPERIRLILPHAIASVEPSGSLPCPLDEFFRSHQPVVTTVGLLEPEYDLSLQIRALEQIRQKLSDAGLVIIGSGSLEGDLQQQIAQLSYRDHVFLCGDLAHAETLRAIADSDLFLRTTLYDGDSISVREALNLAVPVIATDNGMRPDGVRLIPPRSLSDLSCVATELLQTPHARKAEPDSSDENILAVFELYQELMTSPQN